MTKLQILEKFLKVDINNLQAIYNLQQELKTEYAAALSEQKTGKKSASIVRYAVSFIKKQSKIDARWAYVFDCCGRQLFTNSYFIICFTENNQLILPDNLPVCKDNRYEKTQIEFIQKADNAIKSGLEYTNINKKSIKFYKTQGFKYVNINDLVFSIEQLEKVLGFTLGNFDISANNNPAYIKSNEFIGLLCPCYKDNIKDDIAAYDPNIIK